MVKIVWDDFEKCKKEALKYKNISDFKTIASGCYKSCKRNNWIKNIRLLFNNIQKPIDNYLKVESNKNQIIIGLLKNALKRLKNILQEQNLKPILQVLMEHLLEINI